MNKQWHFLSIVAATSLLYFTSCQQNPNKIVSFETNQHVAANEESRLIADTKTEKQRKEDKKKREKRQKDKKKKEENRKKNKNKNKNKKY
jgi:spore coat polysaccharide biosynthesis predicted glycosyltransferase SpsG